MSEKRIALISGASRGIGSCIAKGLAADCYKTILIARNIEKLKAVCEEISKNVSDELIPEYMALDLTDLQKTREIITNIKSKFGTISILVNNAGMWLDGTLDESEDNFKKLLETNLVSPFVFLKEVGKEMKKHRKGHIFNIASRAGIYGFPGCGLYSASKFGLMGLSDSLYREYAEHGVKITSICPGWVNTDMAKEANTPFENHEMIQPADILNSIRYILGLSSSACIREIVIECSKSVL